MAAEQTKVSTSRVVVLQARETLAGWREKGSTAQEELASLQATAGVEFLDDPEAATRLVQQMATLRDQATVADRAADAAQQRVAAAERDYLLAEADVLDKVVERARERVQTHRQRTAELLAQLLEHDGRFVLDGASKSWALEHPAEVAKTQAQILRLLAEGQDPESWLQQEANRTFDGRIAGLLPAELYPDAVSGSNALVPAPYFVATARATQSIMAETEAEAERLDAVATLADERLLEVMNNRDRIEPQSYATYLRGAQEAAELAGNRAIAFRANAGLRPVGG